MVDDKQTAVELGKQFNQISVFDFGTGSTIMTGGTGEPVTDDPKEISERITNVIEEEK